MTGERKCRSRADAVCEMNILTSPGPVQRLALVTELPIDLVDICAGYLTPRQVVDGATAQRVSAADRAVATPYAAPPENQLAFAAPAPTGLDTIWIRSWISLIRIAMRHFLIGVARAARMVSAVGRADPGRSDNKRGNGGTAGRSSPPPAVVIRCWSAATCAPVSWHSTIATCPTGAPA
jgi:hypothetical protein